MTNRQPTAIEADQAALEARLPGWHVWHVLTPYDSRGKISWSAMPEGAGRAAVQSYFTDDLIQKAAHFQAALSFHINRTRRELDNTAEEIFTRRDMLSLDLTAFEKLAGLQN